MHEARVRGDGARRRRALQWVAVCSLVPWAAWAAGQPPGDGGAAAPADAEAAALPAADLPRAWAALRTQRGHFDGAAWNDAVDRFNGRKHVVMQRLAAALLHERATQAQVRQALGRPDRVVGPRSPEQPGLLARAAASGAAVPLGAGLWLYRWRGTHDQLLLAMVQGRLVATAWLLDGE